MFGKLKEKLTGGVSKLNGKTDLLEAIAASCVMVGSADGSLDDSEAEVALERLLNHEVLSISFTTSQIEAAFDKQAKRAKSGMSGRLGLKKEIEEAKGKATADDLEMMLMIAIDVASADGDIGEKEMKALQNIGQLIGIADVKRYLA